MLTIFDSLRELFLFWKLRIAKFYYFCLFDRLWKMSLIFCTFTYKWVSFCFFVSKYWQKVLLLPCFFCRDKICFNIEQHTLAFLKMFVVDMIAPFNFLRLPLSLSIVAISCFFSFHCWYLSHLLSQGQRLLVEFHICCNYPFIHSCWNISKIHNTSPAGNYMFKVNNRNTRTRCETCSKLFFILNFEHISHLILVFLLLTLNMQLQAGSEPVFSIRIFQRHSNTQYCKTISCFLAFDELLGFPALYRI